GRNGRFAHRYSEPRWPPEPGHRAQRRPTRRRVQQILFCTGNVESFPSLLPRRTPAGAFSGAAPSALPRRRGRSLQGPDDSFFLTGMPPPSDRRLAALGLGVAILLMGVFAALMVQYGRELRGEIRAKMIERDAAVLYPIAQQQIEAGAASLSATDAPGISLAA